MQIVTLIFKKTFIKKDIADSMAQCKCNVNKQKVYSIPPEFKNNAMHIKIRLAQ